MTKYIYGIPKFHRIVVELGKWEYFRNISTFLNISGKIASNIAEIENFQQNYNPNKKQTPYD